LTTSNNIQLADVILPAYYDLHKAVKSDCLFVVCKGGRNSAKSSHIAIELILRRMKYNSHALVLRKYEKYNSTSVYEQLKWAIDILQVQAYWKMKVSPLELTYTPTGAKIIFAGGDDPTKIKSIKMSDMPITDLWIEEVAEFRTESDVTTITNSIIRAELPKGLDYKVFLSYNPPKQRQHWLNKKYETQFIPANVYLHHTDYRCNKHLGIQALDEIENCREHNQKRYDWEYLGKPIGSGVVPFSNLEFRKITDDEIKQFDNIRQGVDWGYGVDPLAFMRLHYDKTRRKIYIFDEYYGQKISNRQFAEWVLAKKYNDTMIYADSAEPKSVAEVLSYGIRCIGAKKGSGSVEYGEKWLDDLEGIIIDPDRCPNTAREFESIDYQTDKDGNARAKLMDKDNHSIDCARYALNADMTNNNWGW
jgi:phage terminase large subunit